MVDCPPQNCTVAQYFSPLLVLNLLIPFAFASATTIRRCAETQYD